MVVSVGPSSRRRSPAVSPPEQRSPRAMWPCRTRNCWTLSTTMLRPNRAYGS